MNGSNRLSGLSGLKARPNPSSSEDLDRADRVGEARGVVDRSPRKKPGRKPSKRTFQLHPKVLPDVGQLIADEAEALGLTQGQFVEQMWSAYLEMKNR